MKIFKKILGKLDQFPPSPSHIPNFESKTDLSQIPIFFGWIFNDDPKISQDCAIFIHRQLTTYTAFKDNSLYHSLRHISLREQHLAKFDRFDIEIQNSLYCIASMNSDGYVREAALRFLVKNPTEQTFPFILFRLADWVLIIRQVAKTAIRSLISQQDPTFLIRHHKIIDGLLKVERTQLKGIHQEITEFIFSNENLDLILLKIEAYKEGDRYFIFKNLIKQGKLKDGVLDRILTDKSYLIRLLAVRHKNLTQRPEILKVLLNDKSQIIRNYAIHKIPENRLKEFKSELKPLLFDNSAVIRATSRNLLSKITEQNYTLLYTKELEKNPTAGSIIGLSEVGDKTCLDQIDKFLNSSSARHRAASLFGISNLDYNKAKKLTLILLRDTSNSVKKICVRIIPQRKTTGDLPTLRDIYNQGNHKTKLFVLKAISKYGGWDIAGDFLIGVSEKDKKLSNTACLLLKAWYNYSIRLGTTQTERDRNYVLQAYRQLDTKKLKLSKDIQKVIEEIPFIFR